VNLYGQAAEKSGGFTARLFFVYICDQPESSKAFKIKVVWI
jgi:hypothetical protein